MTIKRLLSFWISLLGAAALYGPQTGCQSGVEEELRLAVIGQDCLVNSDCKQPFKCAFELCHAECEESRDCPAGARCVAAARPYKVCQLEEERRCQRTRDCPEGLICGVDGECRDACESDAQCVTNQRCVGGTCADEDELDDEGQLPVASGQVDRVEGAPCTYFSDCAGVLLCREQICVPECRADKDCSEGSACREGRCALDGSQPKACDYNSDCLTDEGIDVGERCLRGRCLCQCVEDRDCGKGQVCDDCGCVAGPNTCRLNSDCKKPGEICRDNQCDCECKANADCGENRRCDGCGCVDALDVVNGIVNGSVQIGSTLQLERYRGVLEIHGNLTIVSSSLKDLDGALDALTLVQGYLSISSNAELTSVSLPSLTRALSIDAVNNAALTHLDLSALEKTGGISLQSMDQLATLDLSLLQTSQGLYINQAKLLSTLSLPALTQVGYLKLSDLAALELVQCRALHTIDSSVDLYKVGSSTPLTLELNALEHFGTVTEFGTLGSISIRSSRIASLEGFGPPKTTTHVASVEITNNAPLTDCDARKLVTAWTSGNPAGFIYGNVPCDDSAGAVAP